MTAVRRTAPYALVDRAVVAALTEVTRVPRKVSPEKAFAAQAEVLVELLGSAGLADLDRRRVGITTAILIHAYARLDSSRMGYLRFIDDLAAMGRNTADLRCLSDVVGVLGGIGMDLAADWGVHQRIANALRDIGGRARIGGHRDIGRQALDTLAGLANVRFEHILAPEIALDAYNKPLSEARDPSSTDERVNFPPQPAKVSSLKESLPLTPTGQPQRIPPRRSNGRPPMYLRYYECVVKLFSLSRLNFLQAVNKQAEAASLNARELAAMLANLDGRAEHAAVQYGDQDWAVTQAQELLNDTVATLVAWLAAPYADSNGWPAGWQGSEAFAQDVDRIRALASALYRTRRYVWTDTVEETLENIAQRVADEWKPQRSLSSDRTRWRQPVNTTREPAVVVVRALCGLMKDAFGADLDRRALITGRRLLALTAWVGQDQWP
jgi:hypothetical protein